MDTVSFIMQSSEPLQEWKENHHCWDEWEIRIILPLFYSNHHKNDFNNQLEILFKNNNFKEIIAKTILKEQSNASLWTIQKCF